MNSLATNCRGERTSAPAIRAFRAFFSILAISTIWLFGVGAATAGAAATVGISTPAPSASVQGSVNWNATAASPSGIKQVDFYIDNVWRWTDSASPYSYGRDAGRWNTTLLANGSHAIQVLSTANDGSRASHMIFVRVANPAPPTGGAGATTTLTATATPLDHSRVQLRWTVSANIGSVTISRDGAPLATRPAAAGQFTDSMLWPTTAYSYTISGASSTGAVLKTAGPTAAATPALPTAGFTPAFAGNPIWTTPIAPGARTAARNSAFTGYLLENARQPNMTLRRYGVTVYRAEANDPRYGPLSCQWSCSVNDAGRVPIPLGAVPDPGSDAHMTVLSADGTQSWDYYHPTKNSAGDWTATNAGVLVPMNGNGIVPERIAGANAANFAGLAGLVRPEELAQGRIDHALVIGIPGIASGAPACPATHNVGTTDDPDALPEGARLRLDPAVNVSTLQIPAWQKTIALALQVYGGYVRDNSGTLTVYAETSSPTSGGRRYDGWNKANVGLSTTASSQGFASAFPWNRMSVLDFKYGPDC